MFPWTSETRVSCVFFLARYENVPIKYKLSLALYPAAVCTVDTQ